MHDEELQLRSYRVVFDLERRIHKVDRFRIPLPYGLPLRSIAYALGTLAAILVVQRLPGAHSLIGTLPVPARYVLVPCAVAWALTQARIDGRPAHAALWTLARFLVCARRIAGDRPSRLGTFRVQDVTVVPDERSVRYRRARVDGPAVVLLRNAFGSRQRGRTLIAQSAGDRSRMSETRVRLQRGHDW